MDATALVSGVTQFGYGVVGGITAVAAIRIMPGVARWCYGHVISWFTGRPEIVSETDNIRRYSNGGYTDKSTGEFTLGG